MCFPTMPTNRNKYYDLGPTKQYDVEIIREALKQYETVMTEAVNAAPEGSIEKYQLAAERNAARELVAKYSTTLPFYE